MPKKDAQPQVKIVEYPGGSELTADEALAGHYVFAVARDPKKLYAFPDTERLLESWAREKGVKKQFDKARKAFAKPPEDNDVDIDAMWDRINRDTRALKKFAKERGIPIGDPKLLERAHKDRILHSAIVYAQAGFGGECAALTADTYDLSRKFPNGARSCETYGYQNVRLFAQPGYQPPGGVLTAPGGKRYPLTPPFKSVRFI